MSSYAVKIVQQFVGQDNTIAIPRAFVKMTGDYVAAAVLAQLLYWYGKMDREFYKCDTELGEELALSPYQLRRARSALQRFGLVTARRGIPAKMFYSFDEAILEAKLLEFACDKTSETRSNSDTQEQVLQEQVVKKLNNKPSSHLGTINNYKRLHIRLQALKQLHTSFQNFPDAVLSETKDDEPEPDHGLRRDAHASPEPGVESKASEQQQQQQQQQQQLAATSTTSIEDLPRRRVPVDYAALLAAWNDNRGQLPAANAVNMARQRALKRLVDEHGYHQALELIVTATKQVATDEFWLERGYGLDNLLRPGRVVEKAEKYRAVPSVLGSADKRLLTQAQSILEAVTGGNRAN